MDEVPRGQTVVPVPLGVGLNAHVDIAGLGFNVGAGAGGGDVVDVGMGDDVGIVVDSITVW